AGGGPLPREYVAGWLKRGPTGVIGTNKSDAADTVKSLLADCVPGQGPDGLNGAARERLAGVLAARGVLPVTYADWLRVEQAEMDLAMALGRGSRGKLARREASDPACRPGRGLPPGPRLASPCSWPLACELHPARPCE